jgi:RNA polymerase sigma-70 factor (ECF subfamily)
LSVSESTAQRYTLHDPDVRLMLKVRDEDDAASFEELMLRYQNRLLTILEHLMNSREQAEDLAQDVFLRIYRARKTYQPGAKFSTWLFTIANNVARNAKRTLSRRREVNVVATEGSGPMAAHPMEQLAKEASGLMPTRLLDKAEMEQIVRLAMESLNERQRLAVLLSKFEAMSYQEIAETMELSVQAVKSLLSRARGTLRGVLEPYLQEGSLPNGNGKE